MEYMKIDSLNLTKEEKITIKKFSGSTKGALENLLQITNGKLLSELRKYGFEDSCLVEAENGVMDIKT